MDTDRVIFRSNKKASQITGIPVEKMIGMNEIERVSFTTYNDRLHELEKAGLVSREIRENPGHTHLITLYDSPHILILMCNDALICHEEMRKKAQAKQWKNGGPQWYLKP